jgi:hypothetical protein
MITFDEIEKELCCSLHRGGLLVLCVAKEHIADVDRKLREIMPLLKSKDIGVLLFDDDVACVMVPESKKVLALPRDRQ